MDEENGNAYIIVLVTKSGFFTYDYVIREITEQDANENLINKYDPTSESVIGIFDTGLEAQRRRNELRGIYDQNDENKWGNHGAN